MKLPKELTLAEIAAVVNGRAIGPDNTQVKSVAIDPFAAGEGDLAIVFDPKLTRRINECKASAVVVPEGTTTNLPRVEVTRPLLALARMLKAVAPRRFTPEPGVHPTAIVDSSCQLGDKVAIGPYVVVGPQTKIGSGTIIMAGCIIGGGVSIGENCVLHPSCLIADYVQIGNRATLQQGASIGPDGFGYVTEKPSNIERKMAGINEPTDEPNSLLKIPQIGTVILEDDVEVGSYATIDRATMGATIIGKGSKIDNQVMIAHNTRLGQDVIVVAQTAIAGSCQIGDGAVLAGQSAVSDHTKVGRYAIVEGKSGAMRDVPDNEVVAGTPAVPAREHFKSLARIRRLPQMAEEISALKKKVAELEALIKEINVASGARDASD